MIEEIISDVVAVAVWATLISLVLYYRKRLE